MLVRDPLSTFHSPLQGTIFERSTISHFTVTDSTNRRAMEAAAQGAPEGSVFTADEQTAGRGRGNHTWHSPAGQGLYLSVVLRPGWAPNDVLWLSLIAGLAVHAAILHVTTIAADLRWPNDVMLGGRKLGGILTELATEAGRVSRAVVGIGLNLNQPDFPPPLQGFATSLRIETDRDWARDEIMIALLRSFSSEYVAFAQSAGREHIVRRFESTSSYARGARVEVDDDGGAKFAGITQGLDSRGFLRVQTASGMRTVLSGGVRKLSPPV